MPAMCELLHTRSPVYFLAICLPPGTSMIDLSPQASEPDLALVYLASFFETLDCTSPPQGDDAKLDALGRYSHYRCAPRQPEPPAQASYFSSNV